MIDDIDIETQKSDLFKQFFVEHLDRLDMTHERRAQHIHWLDTAGTQSIKVLFDLIWDSNNWTGYSKSRDYQFFVQMWLDYKHLHNLKIDHTIIDALKI